MRTNLNLSRRPFTNRRLFWLGVLGLFALSFGLALWVATEKARYEAQINDLERQKSRKEKVVKDLQTKIATEHKEVQLTILSDQQMYELASARLLLERKGFSWNNLLGDIEGHVPKDTRLVSIKIEEGSKAKQEGAAGIEIKALGKSAAQMTEMMNSLEKSGGVFELDQATQDAVVETNEVPFTLKVIYRPVRGNA